MQVDICIPIYNEEKILVDSTHKLFAFCQSAIKNCDWRIVLLINGSSDNSEKLAQKLSIENNLIKTVVYKEGGRGYALRRYWQESEANIFCYMDSDLAVSLEVLPKLINPLLENQAELVIGSRYVKGAKIQRGLIREIISRGYSFLTQLILKNPQKDLQCGFKAISKIAFTKLTDYAKSPGWFFDTELISWANAKKMKVVEIGVDWQETRFDQRHSTVRLSDIIQDFFFPMFELRKKIKAAK